MNTAQLKGKLQDAIGHAKQSIGEATGNDRVANEGVADQVKGSARETWGNAKDAAGNPQRDLHDDAGSHASETRNTISEKLHQAKDAINEKIDNFKSEHNR